MRTVALISGGKDSCYNMAQCIAEGHKIVALANLKPADKDELDSYMYQTVGHHAIDLYADAMGLPLYRHTIQGVARNTDMDYTLTAEDEVEDLMVLLTKVMKEVHIEAVSVGAILSDYQRIRVEHVCQRLGLTSLAYLWRRDQTELLTEMVDFGISAILVKVASYGLIPEKHLGKNIKDMLPQLISMNTKYQLNVCGEGGEYETFTLDCPLFKKQIILDEVETIQDSKDDVGYLNLKKAHLEDNPQPPVSQTDAVKGIKTQKGECIAMDRKPISDLFQRLSLETCNRNEDGPVSEKHQIRILITDHSLSVTGVMAFHTSDVEESVHCAMRQLKSVMEGQGWGLNDLVIACLYVKNMDNFAQINSVYKQYFGINPPCRICVQTALAENLLLQIDCYGYKGSKVRSTMHVQSISHWASANIGPYSQAVQIGSRIFVAGQIPLDPGSMTIILGDVIDQSLLSLRHVERILQAKHTGCTIQNALSLVCYVTDVLHIPPARDTIKTAFLTNNDKSDPSDIDLMCGRAVYVVVPKLPRAALIEWQCVADTIGEFAETSDSCMFQDHVTSIFYRTRDGESPVFSCTGSTVTQGRVSDEDIVMEKPVACLCACYQRIVSSAPPGVEVLPPLRIFYVYNMFSQDELQTCIETVFTGNLPKSYRSFVLVPVTKLVNPRAIFTFCK